MYINNSPGINYLSLRLKLDDIVKNKDFETKVLENIRYCRNIIGGTFRVVFWNENISEKNVKKFIERNEKLLFEVNTKITKEFGYSWFLIKGKGDKSNSRYSTPGNILNGISMYLKLAKFLVKKQREE